jgi:selenocysteine lyase/cysteine desulfurase
MTDWAAVRAEFPALDNWTYLNTATYGQLPRCAVDAMSRHFAHRDELACADFLSWFDDMDRIRETVARFISCQPDDIAFIQNASSALSLLLSGIDWKSGDQVLTLEDEFPNNLYGLGSLEERGVEFVQCGWDQLQSHVNNRTRLIALSSVNYNTGFAPPLESLDRKGALLYVDGTQSVGGIRFDVQRIRPDVLGVHGYKWLNSPTGAGFMYVSPELRPKLPPSEIGWRSHYDWRSVHNLHHGAPVFSDKAEKYEGGMIPFTLLYGLAASIEMQLQIGLELIEARVLSLAGCVRETLCGLGAQIENYRSPIIAARFESTDPSELTRALRERRVLVAARKGRLRVSPHFYNNEQDIEVLARELRSLL